MREEVNSKVVKQKLDDVYQLISGVRSRSFKEMQVIYDKIVDVVKGKGRRGKYYLFDLEDYAIEHKLHKRYFVISKFLHKYYYLQRKKALKSPEYELLITELMDAYHEYYFCNNLKRKHFKKAYKKTFKDYKSWEGYWSLISVDDEKIKLYLSDSVDTDNFFEYLNKIKPLYRRFVQQYLTEKFKTSKKDEKEYSIRILKEYLQKAEKNKNKKMIQYYNHLLEKYNY